MSLSSILFLRLLVYFTTKIFSTSLDKQSNQRAVLITSWGGNTCTLLTWSPGNLGTSGLTSPTLGSKVTTPRTTALTLSARTGSVGTSSVSTTTTKKIMSICFCKLENVLELVNVYTVERILISTNSDRSPRFHFVRLRCRNPVIILPTS